MKMNISKTFVLFLCIGLLSTGLQAQNDLRDIPKPDLEKELASFSVLDDFEVNHSQVGSANAPPHGLPLPLASPPGSVGGGPYIIII